MTKISKFEVCILATKAMLSGDYKKEQKINNILMHAMIQEKQQGIRTNEIIINENELKVLV